MYLDSLRALLILAAAVKTVQMQLLARQNGICWTVRTVLQNLGSRKSMGTLWEPVKRGLTQLMAAKGARGGPVYRLSPRAPAGSEVDQRRRKQTNPLRISAFCLTCVRMCEVCEPRCQDSARAEVSTQAGED